MVMGMESIKHDPADFGGIQNEMLPMEARAARYCVAAGCPFPGFSQMQLQSTSGPMQIGPPEFRLLCKKHVVLYTLMVAAVLGDPSPTAEAHQIADAIGIDWDMMWDLGDGLPTVFNPEHARCVNCGGGMVGETIGMYSGKRFVHTCGDLKREGP